ncbi:MAG: 50S ribosomal protein L21 [Chlorobi bacterium]|nr:50S ribosomal protein L21 [Chlorobiota bacterium]
MYAIVEIAGQQFKVKKDQKLFVHRLPQAEGESVSFDKVLLIADGDDINIGAPAIEGAEVTAKILRHLKGDKIIVFKKKRRKGYRVKRGHRQYLTEIQIEGITKEGAVQKATAAAEEKPAQPEPAPQAETPKAAPAGKPDDLKKIEGIGPKIASILAESGIDTFEKLAQADPQEISALLVEKGGKRYAMHDPSTWPKQAALAAAGKWDELAELQDKLKGGRE